jgi:protein SCO1/2
MKKTSILASVCACLAAMTVFAKTTAPAEANVRLLSPGFYLPQPLPLDPFKLVDRDSSPFTLDDLRSRWTLVFFGYTHCPDVCPMTMAQIRSVRKSMTTLDDEMPLAVVFVSIDPQRDSAAQLKSYADQFNNDFVGVGGEPLDVDAFAKQFKVKYAIAGGTNDAYFIDHTSSVALVDPKARLRALFSVPLRPDAVAADVRRIAQAETTAF